MNIGLASRVIVLLASLLLGSARAAAEEWATQSGVVKEFQIVKIEPLVAWGGGAVRVLVDSAIPSSFCGGSSTVGDLLLGGGAAGHQESRAATISALYLALASGKKISLYLSTAACNSGAPIILGLDVHAN